MFKLQELQDLKILGPVSRSSVGSSALIRESGENSTRRIHETFPVYKLILYAEEHLSDHKSRGLEERDAES